MKRWLLTAAMVWSLASVATAADVIRPADERFAKATDEVPSFQRHVLPLMGRLGCNGRACHGSFQGQGGFRLSLFGYDFKIDHDALLKGEHPRVDLKNIAASLLLDKPSSDEQDFHGGGKRMDRKSWQYRLIHRWIEAGATPTDQEKDPSFVRLEVSPLEIVFGKVNEKANLRVLSHWSDGSVEDVTPLCRFSTNDDAVAKVDLNGQITILGKGDTHIVAYYDNGVVPVSVLLPVSDQVGPKYPRVPTPTKVDELVVSKLKKLGMSPSDLSTDAEFLRRVSIDITGQLPTAEEVSAFLANTSKAKRTAKIDELLERPAYAAWWATKFNDLLGNSENQLRFNDGVPNNISEQWYRWTYARLRENMHYDDLIERIVLAKGRSSENQSYEDYCREMLGFATEKADASDRDMMPHFWARRNLRKPSEKALSFSYALLGVRLQCAECHKHPFDQWSQQDFNQFTAFFNRVNYGAVDPRDRKDYERIREEAGLNVKTSTMADRRKLATEAIKAGKLIPIDEVYIIPAKNASASSRKDKDKTARIDASRVITPKVLGGEAVVEDTIDDPREPLMQWLRQKDNPYFAKALVNRVWAHYFNVGIVEPADDMNLANAPSNKELLDWLAEEFIEHDYDLKWLHKTITSSRTYQLTWKTNDTNEHDLRNFSHSVPRRLPAEAMLDAVTGSTAGKSELDKRAAEPVELCSVGLGKGYTQRNNGTGYALNVFGKPKRETPCDCERSNEPSLLQTVYLRNDQEMFKLIERSNGFVADTAKQLVLGDVAVQRASIEKSLADYRQQLKSATDSLSSAKSGKGKLSKERVEALKDESKKLANSIRVTEEKLANLSETKLTLADAVKQAYLRTFSRAPSAQELAAAQQYIQDSEDAKAGLRDLVWALINSKEFMVNH